MRQIWLLKVNGVQDGIVEYCFTRMSLVRAIEESSWEKKKTTVIKLAAATNESQWRIRLLAEKSNLVAGPTLAEGEYNDKPGCVHKQFFNKGDHWQQDDVDAFGCERWRDECDYTIGQIETDKYGCSDKLTKLTDTDPKKIKNWCRVRHHWKKNTMTDSAGYIESAMTKVTVKK